MDAFLFLCIVILVISPYIMCYVIVWLDWLRVVRHCHAPTQAWFIIIMMLDLTWRLASGNSD